MLENFRKLNNISGWAVFAIATIVYFLTLEPTASFWDCGEFIASSYKLEVGHPPGAPFFMLLARLFSMFMSVENAALSINLLSAMSSSFTILFLFWTITHMAKKLVFLPIGGEIPSMTMGRLITILGAGAVGALAYTFSDTFWFSAVEGEVYALSSLFTAVVFWAILKWENAFGTSNSSKWIIFIAYLMGLSIGVHLLNLLAIPAIAFVYYFKRYKVTIPGLLATSGIAVLILGFIQAVIIPGTVNYAAKFELLFVNSFGLSFNSGVIVYAIVVLGGLIGLLFLSRKKNWPVLNTSVLSILMILIGYSTFATIVVRSAANPPMDENNPENLFTLLSYLNREQYGDRPLLSGPYWNSPQDSENPTKDGRKTYIPSYSVKKKGVTSDYLIKSFKNEFAAQDYVAKSDEPGLVIVAEYVDTGEKRASIPVYDKEFTTLFPRMYSTQDNHLDDYKMWSDYQGSSTQRGRLRLQEKEKQLDEIDRTLQQMQQLIQYVDGGGTDPRAISNYDQAREQYSIYLQQRDKLTTKLLPTAGENFNYFTRFQIGHMYGRYFMWNFAGRQSDVQSHGGILDGNWLSGIDVIDGQRLGNRDEVPQHKLDNKALNKFYFLPLLLGLIGLIFQFARNPKDGTVVALLFLFTGLAIVLYLNQTPRQPRERDYAYVGSFYSFAIWIGLSVCALRYAATQLTTQRLLPILAICIGAPVLFYITELITGDEQTSHAFSYSFMFMGGLAALLMAAFHFLGKAVHNDKVPSIIAVGLLMIVPAIMLNAGWDDHNRAKRKTASDFAKNYLDSLEPNAILFTNGDNDTFPLWYAQEVEGYRTDVRIVNLSLLNTDWYIDQLKRKAYESDPVPFSVEEQQYRQGTRDIVLLGQAVADSVYTPVAEAIDYALDDSKAEDLGGGKSYNSLPTDRFMLPVDRARAKEIVPEKDWDKIVDEVTWRLRKPYVLKSTFMALDLIANNNWERPVYFAVTTGRDAYMNLGDYFQLEGLAYRLVPAKFPKSDNPNVLGGIHEDAMFDMVMNKFQWGNMDYTEGDGIYMDENNRRMTTNLRLQLSTLAEELIKEDDFERAQAVLDKTLAVMPEKNVPYDRVMIPIVDNLYAVGDTKKADEITMRLFEKSKAELKYYFSLEDQFLGSIGDEPLMALSTIANLDQMTNLIYNESEVGAQIQEEFKALEAEYQLQITQGRIRGEASF